MNSSQFKRWLAAQGCSFEPAKGGHLWVRRDGRKSIIPMHGGKKQLGTGLINRIKRDLGLK
jgi:mRNA interferase HicA